MLFCGSIIAGLTFELLCIFKNSNVVASLVSMLSHIYGGDTTSRKKERSYGVVLQIELKF